MSLYAAGSSYREGVIEYDFFYEPGTFHYFTAGFEPDSFDSMRDSFIGAYRTETNPVAVELGVCGGTTELGGNHCGALHRRVTLPAGESVRLTFMLGVGPREQGTQVRARYRNEDAVDAAFAGLSSYWEEKLAVFQCRTPHPGLDTMINTRTLYPAEACAGDRKSVVWG